MKNTKKENKALAEFRSIFGRDPNSAEKYWLQRDGIKSLYSVEELPYYKKKYIKIHTVIYNTIKNYDMAYCNFGRNIFCRELAEEIVYLIENDLRQEVLKLLKAKCIK